MVGKKLNERERFFEWLISINQKFGNYEQNGLGYIYVTPTSRIRPMSEKDDQNPK